jgi:O-antigen/teichoic acid export membrane protein
MSHTGPARGYDVSEPTAAALVPPAARSVVRRNIVANYVGGIWATLLSLAFIPLYVRFLGAEAYGLIGVFALVQAMLSLLDLGLGTTFNRELARLAVKQDRPGQLHTLTFTLEVVYWGVGFVIAASLFLLAGPLARDWVRPDQLTVSTIQGAAQLMALSILFQWPTVLYVGGLQGLQRHVAYNIITAGFGTVRAVGAILALWLIAPTIYVFFGWQVIASVLHVIALRIGLWRALPASDRKASFDAGELRRIWRFAAGMTGISLVSLLLTQADKVVLSRMLSLEMFGYYTIATVAGGALYRVITPVFGAVFPRLSELVRQDDEVALQRVFHRSCQLIAVLLFPAAAVIALFSPEILHVWTRDAGVVAHGSLVMTLWVIGVALNGCMNVPYALQLATGWTRLAFLSNVVAVIVLIPGMVVAAKFHGAPGAAAMWVVLNLGYYLITAQLMFRRLLPQSKLRWYTLDTSVPLLLSLGVAGMGKLFVSAVPMSLTWQVVSIAVTGMLAVAACSATAPWMWQELRSMLRRTGAASPELTSARL